MKNAYLKAMGIEVWRERSKEFIENQLKLIELLNSQHNHQAYLLMSVLPEFFLLDALKLLDAMLVAIDLQRGSERIFDLNFLVKERPKPILLLGEELAQSFLRSASPMSRLRGQCHYPSTHPSLAVFPIFGVEEILANPKLKRAVWDDLRLFQGALT